MFLNFEKLRYKWCYWFSCKTNSVSNLPYRAIVSCGLEVGIKLKSTSDS